jgi:hypothetical protein
VAESSEMEQKQVSSYDPEGDPRERQHYYCVLCTSEVENYSTSAVRSSKSTFL